MKNKIKRFLGAMLLVFTLFTTIAPVVNAATYDYKSSHYKTDSLGTKITKSAAWVGNDESEAEITITVETEKKEAKKVMNADIIYFIDKSDSMGKDVGLVYSSVRGLMADTMPYYVQDTDLNNRVAFASFSSRLYTYDGGKKYWHEYYKWAVSPKGNSTSYTDHVLCDALTFNDTKSLGVASAREKFYAAASGSGAIKFYSTKSQINKALETGFRKHSDGENTNFDLPLFAAEYLLSTRTGEEKNRKPFIIFITEGQPYPNYDTGDDARNAGESSSNSRKKYGDSGRNADYVANKYYKNIAKNLKNKYGATIYAIILQRNKCDEDMWNAICSEGGLYLVGDDYTSATAKIESIHKQIEKSIVTQTQVKELKATVTDVIDSNLFEIVSGDNRYETNIGTVTINGNKVTWNISGINYGAVCSDGNVPTLKIRVRLKDNISDDNIKLYKQKWYVNTNKIQPKDNGCTYVDQSLPNTSTPVPTPWLKINKYKVTEKWIDKATGKEIVSSKSSEVLKNTSYTVDRKDLTSKDYVYDSSEPTESVLKITADTTIKHYYIKNVPDVYTVTERYVDKATNKDIGNGTYTKVTNSIAKNTKYNVTILDIPNYTYSGESSPAGSSFTINEDKEIIHYYNKNPEKYTVTVKHMDDHLNDYIYYSDGTKAENKFEMIENSTWPETGNIRGRYALEETADTLNPVVAAFGQNYSGYKLDTENIKVNGTVYNLDTLPSALKIDENKVVEFHYYKEGRLNVGFYLRQKVDGEVEPNKFFSRGGYRQATKIGVKNSIKIPTVAEINNINAGSYEALSDSAKFVGYRVVYAPTTAEELFINENTTLSKNKSIGSTLEYTIPQNKSDVHIYLVYEEEKYSVKVEYYLEDGVTPIGDWPDPEYVKSGDDFYPNVPQRIIDEAGEEYEFVKRDDGKDREAKIPDIDEPTVLKCYYKPVKKLIVNYVDAFTGESIEPYKDVVTENLTNPVPMTHLDIHEENVPSEYTFGKRTDGKPNESDPIDLNGTITEVTFKYWRPDPPPEFGMPVVSDPKLSKKEENGSWSAERDKVEVLVGESIKVYIPNDPDAIHDQVELEPEFMGIIPKPADGWNSEYAKVKYLVCGCDVYYNGDVVEVGTSIRIEADVEEVELIIPEWVMEDTYTIEVIVGSEDKANLYYPNKERYNRIHEETAAYNTVEIEVWGKVYDFTITNLVEDEYWESSLFYEDDVNYKANLVPNDSKLGVLPIGQGPNGTTTNKQQADKYNHGIALGSTFFFNINTLGKKNQAISIKPIFKYVPIGANTAIDVDLYIETENGKYENITETDGQVIQTQLNNDYKKENTNLGLEMSYAFGIGNGVVEFKDLKTNASYDLVTGARLHIDKQQRVPFKEYFAEEGITRYSEGSEAYDKVLTSACHWYGEYRIPSSTKVMKKGATPGNGTEYKDGFIIVLFEIITQDVENATVHNTNKYLLYEKQFVGNQWANEGGAKPEENAETVKMNLVMPRLKAETNGQNVLLEFDKNTYPVAIYDVAVRANGKYEAAGTH